MKFNVPTAVTSRAAKAAFLAGENSPKILFIGGIVGFGATVGLACKATLKLEGELSRVEKLRSAIRDEASENPDKYSASEFKKLNALVTVKGVLAVGRLYLPALAVGSLTIAALTKSHNIMARRNAGLSAALAVTNKALQDYRQRVREDAGVDKDRQYMFGPDEELPKSKQISVDKDAEELRKKPLRDQGPDHLSQYARLYSELNVNWHDEPEYRFNFLKMTESWANKKLEQQGHLLLNDVYDALGMERSPEGALVGWAWKKPNGGDGYVDFGIFANERSFYDFITDKADAIALDFNVDGEVWKLI